MKMDGKGVKDNAERPRYDLISPEVLECLAKVMKYGIKNRGECNWERGVPWSKMYRPAQGHMNDFWMGKDIDDDSGLPVLAHALCCNMMLLHYQLKKYNKFDDRPNDKAKRT